jgi:HAD superfamily hydrolase (TIGR01484 family)
MDIKLVALDVDGTIAEPSKPVKREIAEKLQTLEGRGVRIVLASGKSSSYLSGLARGMGIKNPLLIGENGCVIFDPVEIKEIKLVERPMEILTIESEVVSRFADSIWLQPTQVELTIFPKVKKTLPELISCVRESVKPFSEKVVMFEHEDAIDILPTGIDKGKALGKINKLYGVNRETVVVVGDSNSDIPMFREATSFLIVGNKISYYEGAKRFPTIKEALDFVEDLI